MLKFIDLFAGLGGFHVGLEQLGMECVFASELDEDLRDLYHINHGLAKDMIRGDIRDVSEHEIPQHSLLCAGFPCQPFSKAGAQVGLSDEVRGNLFYQIMRIINHHKPKYVMLENVANLLKHDNNNTWAVIKKTLQDAGYDVQHRILSPHQFGVPQLRQRMFIIAARKNEGGLTNFDWPQIQSHAHLSVRSIIEQEPAEADIRRLMDKELKAVAVWQKFLDCIPKEDAIPSFPIWATEYKATYPFESEVPGKLRKSKLAPYSGVFGESLADMTSKQQEELIPTYARGKKLFEKWKQQFIRDNRAFFKKYESQLEEVMAEIRGLPFSWQKFEWNCKGEERNLSNLILQFRPSGIRVKRANYFPALVASTRTQVPAIGWLDRYITLKEGKSLQSLGDIKLPDKNTAAFKALGNAVNAEVVKRIAACLVPLPDLHQEYQSAQRRITFPSTTLVTI